MNTVSLVFAKQLREAGYPQQTKFSWQRSWHDKPYMFNPGGSFETADKEAWFAAPTADEILEKLPMEIYTGNSCYQLTIQKIATGLWGIKYTTEYPARTEDRQLAALGTHELADAAAKMWIYLKKENLL